MKYALPPSILIGTALCLGPAISQASADQSAAEGTAYSPYAGESIPNKVYWGDTHLHTGLSLDAGLFGNILGPDEAWRFARGEEVISSTGLPVKLGRPLDWMVLTDHSDLMGIAPDIQNGAPNVLAVPKARAWHEGFKQGGKAAGEAAFDLMDGDLAGDLGGENGEDRADESSFELAGLSAAGAALGMDEPAQVSSGFDTDGLSDHDFGDE